MELVQNIPKLYTAQAEWMSCVMMIIVYRNYIKKEKISRLVIFSILVGGILAIIQLFCGLFSNAWWLLGMAAAVGTMTFYMKNCMRLNTAMAFYLCARAFMRAELLASLEWQLYTFYFDQSRRNTLSGFIFCVIFFITGYVVFYWIEKKRLPEHLEKSTFEVTKEQLLQGWIITILMFALSNLSYIQITSPFTGSAENEIFNIRTLMDLAGVLILEIFHLQKSNEDKKQEMHAIQNILTLQYAQFRESQENKDVLNTKYHDLKQQIQIIREETNIGKRENYLEEIERGIEQYDAEIKTGNPALDTILTSKSRICKKQNIELTVVADGRLIRQLHVMDLCTVFGNALDNAIEYEVQVEDMEKRLIHVSVSEKNRWVCILIENYYEGNLQPDKELPATTKRDKRYHGYGLKSIRYSVSKYGGCFNMAVKDRWFRVEILLPQE